MNLQIQIGGLTLRFVGPAKFLDKKNLLAFDFTEMQIWLGERSLYAKNLRAGQDKREAFDGLSVAKLPFFAFFCISEEFIAARGRGGGLAMWIREVTDPHSS